MQPATGRVQNWLLPSGSLWGEDGLDLTSLPRVSRPEQAHPADPPLVGVPAPDLMG